MMAVILTAFIIVELLIVGDIMLEALQAKIIVVL